jgi:hypothetical protein
MMPFYWQSRVPSWLLHPPDIHPTMRPMKPSKNGERGIGNTAASVESRVEIHPTSTRIHPTNVLPLYQ